MRIFNTKKGANALETAKSLCGIGVFAVKRFAIRRFHCSILVLSILLLSFW